MKKAFFSLMMGAWLASHKAFVRVVSDLSAVPFPNGKGFLLDERRRIVANLDSFSLTRNLRQARLASHKGMILLLELQSQTQEELDAFLPSVLDRK